MDTIERNRGEQALQTPTDEFRYKLRRPIGYIYFFHLSLTVSGAFAADLGVAT